MRPVCPECNGRNSEDTTACAICRTSLRSSQPDRPVEGPWSPPEVADEVYRWIENPLTPTPQPAEFAVNRSGNEPTISWGTDRRRRASAVGFVALSLLLIGLGIITTTDSDILMFAVLFLLGTVLWLVAMYTIRTILRLSDREWVIWKGSVLSPIQAFYSGLERRIDPSKYKEIFAVKDPDKKYSWGHMPNLVDIFFELVLWLVHQGTKGSRVTYTLYGRTRSGDRAKLATGLKERQARYLQRQLQGFLCAVVRPVAEARAPGQDMAVQPASPGQALDSPAKAAKVRVEPMGPERKLQSSSSPVHPARRGTPRTARTAASAAHL